MISGSLIGNPNQQTPPPDATAGLDRPAASVLMGSMLGEGHVLYQRISDQVDLISNLFSVYGGLKSSGSEIEAMLSLHQQFTSLLEEGVLDLGVMARGAFQRFETFGPFVGDLLDWMEGYKRWRDSVAGPELYLETVRSLLARDQVMWARSVATTGLGKYPEDLSLRRVAKGGTCQ